MAVDLYLKGLENQRLQEQKSLCSICWNKRKEFVTDCERKKDSEEYIFSKMRNKYMSFNIE